MTATTSSSQSARKLPGAFLFLVLLIILLFVAMRIEFQTDHARQRHNREPDLAEQCLNRNGVAYALMEPSGRVHLICRESDSEFYDVIYKERRVLDGITAFRVNTVTYKGITYEFHTINEYVEFLMWRGDTMLPASQFTGPFIFIFP